MRKTLSLSLLAIVFGGIATAAQMPAAPVYAIRGAKIVTAAGATIDKGNVVMRNGLIVDVGATAVIPDDAAVVDGNGMTVYPGLIDMGNSAALQAPAGAQGGRGGAQNAGPAPQTWAEADRIKRDAILNADYAAAEHVRLSGPDLQRYAAAGITSVLALPPTGLIKGQSALINIVAGADADDVSAVAGYRRGSVVIKAGVAQHVSFTDRGTGPGYPAALLGSIAFVRQAFSDAQWQKDARAWADKHKDQPRPTLEPALDALTPALEGRMPVMFEAGELREILRALAMAKEFKLDPVILGGLEAAAVTADLKAANAKVVLTLNTGGIGGRGAGAGGETAIRITRMQQNAPKNAAALEAAGVAYAFSTEGLPNPADFVRGVARAVRDGGLTADQAIRALTINAARMAGAADRIGSIEKGKIANLIVTDGDLFADGTRVRRVFIDGREVR
jgi:imidazolonepropionase-like amidohydrolase